MNIFAIVLLILVMVADAILGLVVWLRAPNKKINTIFALLTLSLIVWSATGFYEQTATGPGNLVLPLATVPFIGALFMVYFITLFSLNFPETHPNPRSTRIKALIALNTTSVPLLAILIFGQSLMVASVTTSAAQGNNIVTGPLYGLFPLYCLGWLIFALGNMFHKFRHAQRKIERAQLNYIFLGLLLMTAVAFLTNIVMPTLAHNPTLSRFGFLSTLFIAGFFGYTIVTQRLFNIRLLVARSVAYILLLVTLIVLYGLAVFAMGGLFFPDSSFTSLEGGIFVALAIVISFTLHPLRRFFEKITDGIFFRDRYDSQIVLDNISSILATELYLEHILDHSLKELCQRIRISGAQFILLEGEDVYRQTHYGSATLKYPSKGELKALHHPILVVDELEPGRRKDLLDRYGIQVSLMLRTREEMVGYLLLGDKLSGEIYSNQDLALLEILRKQLAVAIVNARAYEEIAQFNETLQQQVHKATARLRSANKNLKVLDKTKDEFLSMASHQLGTPLTAITGYLSMALEDPGKMSPNQRQFVEYALEASERMGAMTSDLLNVSRLNAGRFVIRREEADLSAMVREEVEQLRAAAERKGLKLTFGNTTLPLIPLDVSKTRQVIMNFIDNAIYYTESGSIHVQLERVHEAVALTVKDTGIGVPESEKIKLFNKFFRADNAKVTRPDGTGLGLYLAKRVIEEQGGSLIFESEMGMGSTFGFMLPLEPSERPATRQAAGHKESAHRS